MELGFNRKEIMALLDGNLQDLTANFEEQITKMRKEGQEPEISLATLLTSSMLSMLEAVSAVIEVNNQKIMEDLKSQGLLK